MVKKKTKHFKNCLGVFQGGGCKALAFVGAYKESVERGVFFSCVAGTSAGAVIAALIAAGATPEYMEGVISETNFDSFKRAPDKGMLADNFRWKEELLSRVSTEYKSIAPFLKHFGVFSSSEIEKWLETKLRELLKAEHFETIKFSDLNIPLSIVATELGGAKPKVWSSETTPDASVAYAVRCSCTIPVFFQPVDSKFVDGGMISNLPTFAIKNSQNSSFEKLLCFTFALSNDKNYTPENNNLTIKQYLKNLISSVIDTAVHIQSELQQNLHIIEIGDLPLGTLDFDKVTEDSAKKMLVAGQVAAGRFFDSETTHIRDSQDSRFILITEPEALNQIVREDVSKGEEIIISLNTTRYVWNLFPTMLQWRMLEVKLTFLTLPIQRITNEGDKQKELFRRLVLKGLGANVVELVALPFEAVIFRRQQYSRSVIVFQNDRKPCFGVRYEKTYDSVAIDSICSALINNVSIEHQSNIPQIEIFKGGVDELFKRLKTVDQYSSSQVTLSIEEVDVSKIVFLTKFVKSYKYNQIQMLFDIFKSKNIELFESAVIRYRAADFDIEMPITPPVAEAHGDLLYLIEGNSRLTYMIKELNAKKVKLVVVRNASAQLPTVGRFNPDQLLVSDEDKTGKNRFEKFDYSAYRSIEEAVRHPSIYKDYL